MSHSECPFAVSHEGASKEHAESLHPYNMCTILDSDCVDSCREALVVMLILKTLVMHTDLAVIIHNMI
jgi:hypothetical protein